MLNRYFVSEKFRYKTNEFNHRLGFPEEAIVKVGKLYKRIDYFKSVFINDLTLQPKSNIMFYMTQTGFDTFAMFFAATELDLNIVDTDPDILIHNLPDTLLIDQQFDNYRNYSYHDICDVGKIKTVDYEQTGDSYIYGVHQKDYQVPSLPFKGNVLHTKYCTVPKLVLQWMLPALANDSVESHICLGFNDAEDGMGRISFVVQRLDINYIVLPCNESIKKFYQEIRLRNVSTEHVEIYHWNNNELRIPKNDLENIKEDPNVKNIPQKYNVKGKLLKDDTNNEYYFQFEHQVENSIAKIKIKIMSRELEMRTGKKISKYGYLESGTDESIMIFRNMKDD